MAAAIDAKITSSNKLQLPNGNFVAEVFLESSILDEDIPLILCLLGEKISPKSSLLNILGYNPFASYKISVESPSQNDFHGIVIYKKLPTSDSNFDQEAVDHMLPFNTCIDIEYFSINSESTLCLDSPDDPLEMKMILKGLATCPVNVSLVLIDASQSNLSSILIHHLETALSLDLPIAICFNKTDSVAESSLTLLIKNLASTVMKYGKTLELYSGLDTLADSAKINVLFNSCNSEISMDELKHFIFTCSQENRLDGNSEFMAVVSDLDSGSSLTISENCFLLTVLVISGCYRLSENQELLIESLQSDSQVVVKVKSMIRYGQQVYRVKMGQIVTISIEPPDSNFLCRGLLIANCFLKSTSHFTAEMYFYDGSNALEIKMTLKIIIRLFDIPVLVDHVENINDKFSRIRFLILENPMIIIPNSIVGIWTDKIKCIGRVL